MKKKITAVLLLWLLVLVLLNRDLFHYSYRFPFSRSFSAESEQKGEYILSEALTLKPAVYHLVFNGEVSSSGCGWFLRDALDEVFSAGDFTPCSLSENVELHIKKPVQLRVGIRYDPAAELRVENFTLSSDKVLYKESLLRHLTVSFFVTLLIAWCGTQWISAERLYRVFRCERGEFLTCEKILLALLLISLISVYPCLSRRVYIFGDDFYFHLRRIDGIAASLRAGHFPAKIYLSWMENYGVACGFYYPDVFLYLPAVMNLLGFNLLTADNLFMLICSFSAVISMYIAGKRLGKDSRFAGFIAALLYAFAAYRLICMFYRSALGEVQAFMFGPWIVLGFYEIFHGRPELWWLFAFGFWGLLSCHLISLAIAGLFVIFAMLLHCRCLRDKSVLLALLKSVVLVLSLGAGFWMPMIEQTLNNQLFFSGFMFSTDRTVGPANWMPFSALFRFFDPWNFVNGSYRPYLGWPLLVALLVALIVVIKRKSDSALRKMLLLAVLGLWMSTSLFPWHLFVWFLKRIQVTWRILTPVSVLLSLCGGISAEVLCKSERTRRIVFGVMVLFCFACAYPICSHAIAQRGIPWRENNVLSDQEVNAGEYMPVGMDSLWVERRKDTIDISGDARVLCYKREGLTFRFDFEAAELVEFTIPFVYQYGYRGELKTESGSFEIPIKPAENGLVTVENGNAQTGTLSVSYHATAIQRIGEVITLLTLLFCAFCFAKRKHTVMTTI